MFISVSYTHLMSQWIVSLHDSGNIRKMKDAGADEILLAVPFFSLRPAHVLSLIHI